MSGTIKYSVVIFKKEIMLMSNTFGFEGVADFFSSALRINEFGSILPIAIFVGISERIAYYFFGLDSMEFIALIVLFILEIITGIWASKTKYKEYKEFLSKNKEKLSKIELCEMLDNIEKYRFSSGRLKRAGAVMGFWLIIIFIIWQFTTNDRHPTLAVIFNTLHFIFLSYIIGIYLVSVIENIAVISKKKDKFTPLSIIKRILKLD